MPEEQTMSERTAEPRDLATDGHAVRRPPEREHVTTRQRANVVRHSDHAPMVSALGVLPVYCAIVTKASGLDVAGQSSRAAAATLARLAFDGVRLPTVRLVLSGNRSTQKGRATVARPSRAPRVAEAAKQRGRE